MIAQISLNTSLIIYLLWLLPQVALNFKRKDTTGFSMLTHGILYFGYINDLLYGFGRDMQWQYRMVTIMGLINLSIQHYQFFRYGLQTQQEKTLFKGLSVLFIVMFAYAAWVITTASQTKGFYVSAGMISGACFLTYMLPQLFTNYQNKSTTGLSTLFVACALFLNVCDSTSAWLLSWDYPSKIVPAVAFIINSILILQIIYYAKKSQLVVNR